MRQSSKRPVIRATLAGILLVSLALLPGHGRSQTLAEAGTTLTQIAATVNGSLGLPSDPAPRKESSDQALGPLVPATLPLDQMVPATGDFGALGLPCSTEFSAEPGAGGTVHLRLEVPCQPSARVVIEHGELAASYLTSSSGAVEADFPAFAETARYVALLPDGSRIAASARVPDAAGYERMVTMWQGDAALSIHAFEYGAGIGAAGHVWREAPRAASVAESGRGGFLMSLGARDLPGAHRAEVYSFPATEHARAGVVRIALSAASGPGTCGRPLSATTLQLGRDLPGAPVAVTLMMPDCAAGEGDLMLKNLARDLKIAAN